MCGHEHDAVTGKQRGAFQVYRITCGRTVHRRVFGLLLIVERQRAPTRPAAEDHGFVAKALFCILDTGA